MEVRHPEADIRGWLAEHPDAVNAYTRQRITEGYGYVDRMLSRTQSDRQRSAYDVGCGTGFDSFALAMHFDRVLAIDASRRWTRAARRLARRTGVGHVDFERRRVEVYAPGERFDFVYCNIMSEQVRSRRALIERLVEAAGPGGEIFYAQACEGYPPTEIARAIERRDGVELRLRLRQTINGFAGRPAFRFYLAGSAAPLFEAAGASVVGSDVGRTNGLPTVERLWLRRSDQADGPARSRAGGDADYLELPTGFEALRQTFLSAVTGDGRSKPELIERARDGSNPLAPWLVLLVMALETPGARPQEAGWLRSRVGDKGLRPLRPRDPDWDRMHELIAEFERLTGATRSSPGLEA
jgi:SAM-dependent methyltransferase